MSKKEEVQEEVRLLPEDIVAGAANFGTSPELMAGALYGVTVPISRAEAADRLVQFMAQAVQKGE